MTLIELMISVTLLAVVMSAVIGAMINISRAMSKQQDLSLLHRESELMNARISHSISGSFGWVYGDSTCLVLVSKDGDSINYQWSKCDSMLLINGSKGLSAAGVLIPSFNIKYIPRATAQRIIPEEQWLNEVDLDQNGSISGGELLLTDYIKMDYIVTKGKAQYIAFFMMKLPPAVTNIKIDRER